ncbi:MAG: hypothetical protein AAF909_10760 [Pseudomonadota bacterium]
MCKAPKQKAIEPPAPPPPPVPNPPSAPAFTEDRRQRDREGERSSERRLGRAALRIDLQAPSASGQGLRLPNK